MGTTTATSSDTAPRTHARSVARPALRWAVAILAVWSLARLAGADRIPVLAGLLVPLLAFTPYAALLSIVVMVCALALRHWRTLGVTVTVAGAFALAVVPRAVGDSASTVSGPSLRVLTANLRFGQADPRALVALVRRTRADVLSVQEFTPEAATGLDRAGLAGLLPYKVTMPMTGAQGSGLYARYPLRTLPTFEVAQIGLAMPHAEMRLPGGRRVEMMAVHLARPMTPAGVGQWHRAFVLVPAGARRGVVRLLAGDFNATLDHAPLRGLLGEGYLDAANAAGKGLTPTFRKWWLPPITLDHILVDRRCAVRQVEVYDLPRSDHRAVFARLRLR